MYKRQILNEQQKVRVKLGLIAVAEGLMTQEEADRVNQLQAVMDRRFGDIAVEKGYLTEGQVNSLLKKQGNAYPVSYTHLYCAADYETGNCNTGYFFLCIKLEQSVYTVGSSDGSEKIYYADHGQPVKRRYLQDGIWFCIFRSFPDGTAPDCCISAFIQRCV